MFSLRDFTSLNMAVGAYIPAKGFGSHMHLIRLAHVCPACRSVGIRLGRGEKIEDIVASSSQVSACSWPLNTGTSLLRCWLASWVACRRVFKLPQQHAGMFA